MPHTIIVHKQWHRQTLGQCYRSFCFLISFINVIALPTDSRHKWVYYDIQEDPEQIPLTSLKSRGIQSLSFVYCSSDRGWFMRLASYVATQM